MLQEVKEKFPKWTKELNGGLCLSDDIDSLLSCVYLQQAKQSLKIEGFYDFSNIYKTENREDKNINFIGVDIDLCKGRCFSNHVTMINTREYNEKSANLNVINRINTNSYYYKFCGSTLLEIISLYDLDLSKCSKKGLQIIAAIDSTYLSYTFKPYLQLCKKYVKDTMQLDSIYKTIENTTKEEFHQIEKEFNLKGKIWVNKNGYLETDIKLDKIAAEIGLKVELPKQKFITIKTQYKLKNTNQYIGYVSSIKQLKTMKNTDAIFSIAITKKDLVKFTYALKCKNN